MGLLLILAIPLFYSVGMAINQRLLQYRVNERLNTEILQTITLPADDINWVKTGKELIIEGRLFDVRSFRTEGNNIFLTGFFDCKEDKLVKQVKDLFHQKSGYGSPFNLSAVKFLLVPIYSANSEITYHSRWKLVSRQYYSFDEMLPYPPGHTLIQPPRS